MNDYLLRPRTIVPNLIGNACIRYNRLDEIFEDIDIDSDTILFHVNAEDIFYRFYRDKDLNLLLHNEIEYMVQDCVIGFINFLAHYRMYFATKLHKNNKIFVYWNYQKPAYQKYTIGDYRKLYFDLYKSEKYQVINKVIDRALPMIQNLLNYIEGIYWVNNYNIDTFTAISYTIHHKEYKKFFHIIFTKNLLTTQLLKRNVVQLFQNKKHPKGKDGKREIIDKSFLITKDTAYKKGILNDRIMKVKKELPLEFLPIIWSVSICSDINLERGISSSITATYQLVLKYYQNEWIAPGCTIQQFINVYKEHHTEEENKEVDKYYDRLINRYCVVNLKIAEQSIRKQQHIQLYNRFIDLYDQSTLERINEELVLYTSDQNILNLNALNMAVVKQKNKSKYRIDFDLLDYLD